MKVLSSKVAALFLLLWGFVNAVPYFGDFRHHVTLPQLIPPMLPIEPQSQASTQRLSQIWQPFGNNPFPVYSNFDGETEFLPLEHQQQQQQRGRGPQVREKPFNIDVVTSDVGGDSGVSPPNIFFQQSFPFFGNDFFNSFGGFGFGAGPHQEPWWKGPNVCTDKEEDEKVTDPKEPTEETGEIVPGASETVEVHPQLFDSFHFSVNSCIEKPNKHVCTRIINQNGKKKTLTITRQCCHGYGRPRNADVATPCDKIEIKDIEETAVDMGAKEFIASAKSNGLNDIIGNRKNITIFMPIDSAFSSFSEQMLNENNLVESKSDGIMRNLFLRHIVLGEVNLDDVSNDQLLETQMAGQKVRINSYQLPPSLGTEPLRYTANCVPVEKHDKLTEQGLVHTLGGVMKPVTANVMEIIRQRNDLSVMRTVLEKTKLSELLEGEKPVTIFVPTDEAFEKLEPHLRRALKEGKGCATNILKNHILDLTFCSVASIAGTKTTAYNILGEAMRFNRSKAGVDTTSEASEIADLTAQEKQQKQQEQPVLINGNAKIIVADLMGTNGVVHIIDTVIPTTSALPLSTLMQEKNVTLFKRLVEAAGLDDKFDDMDNATIFAPTDKALEGTKWAQILAESPEKLKNNPELLELINYHVVNPMTKTCDLTEKLLPTAAGGNVRINLYSTHALFSNVMNRATVNCARLVHFDDESCGSVLHQVDKVLTAPKANLLELLESNPSYSKFLELVRAANLSSVLTNMDQSFTLLVPKDEVFEEVEDWEKTLKKDQHELENLVKTHIVNDVVCCAGIIPTNWPFVRTIESINGAHLHITRERRPKIENAGVTKCDTIAQNGIVHEINDIIVPKRRQLRPPQQQQPQSQHSIDQFGDLFF